jgi:hypothetical protein
MSDLEKRWDTKLPQSVSMHVLCRPVETTILCSYLYRQAALVTEEPNAR